ncbi:hypothetical protein [Bacillus cereus]|uniref:Uncharacterized protein n=1 Tax=Bacillus cereus VD184 TaxID=1053242 RepID=A0A9W5RB03_BACCE|nr:hypothetical protein [Bacillus cereus]EOQ18634.1 hypothetical protein IKC_05135 [Bacillus cereus VD184]
MEGKYEIRVLKKQLEIAINTLKRMSEQETDSCKKLDIDYVITVLTDKPHGRMPF